MIRPVFAPVHLRPILAAMLESMLDCRLEVTLIPSVVPDCAADGGMIRAVVDRNPAWYRDLCASYPSERRRGGRVHRGEPKTRVKRHTAMAVLVELLHGGSRSKYAQDLLDVARGFEERAGEDVGGWMFAEDYGREVWS